MHFMTCIALFISISFIIANTFSIADQSKIPVITSQFILEFQGIEVIYTNHVDIQLHKL